MIRWCTGIVSEIIGHGIDRALQEIRVQLDQPILIEAQSAQEYPVSAKAIHYTSHMPSLRLGDRVLLNTTAVDLQLGSGGYHYVYKVLNRIEELLDPKKKFHAKGHMMKLRYTPQQHAFFAVEEEESPYHTVFSVEQNLDGIPVLIGELHSMLPILLCRFRYLFEERRKQSRKNGSPMVEDYPRISYIMSDGGALPLAYSNHVEMLQNLKWIEGTVTYGQAFGGDLEAMNKFTALIAARHVQKADIIIVIMGPGIAGTGTLLGHSGVEAGEIINAASILGGVPVMIPRISFAEARGRHYGLSHHTTNSLSKIALKKAILPLPQDLPLNFRSILEQQVQAFMYDSSIVSHEIRWIKGLTPASVHASHALYPLPITTMGRELNEDACYFQGVCAAAEFVWDYGVAWDHH
ncbi:MAG TPA: DUF3866 family protein [Bacilli bacterium]